MPKIGEIPNTWYVCTGTHRIAWAKDDDGRGGTWTTTRNDGKVEHVRHITLGEKN